MRSLMSLRPVASLLTAQLTSQPVPTRIQDGLLFAESGGGVTYP
jgi:hypothetical protein